MYDVFIADCKREMRLKKIKNADLANVTGFKKSTIDAFFTETQGRKRSETVALAIGQALNVELAKEEMSERIQKKRHRTGCRIRNRLGR